MKHRHTIPIGPVAATCAALCVLVLGGCPPAGPPPGAELSLTVAESGFCVEAGSGFAPEARRTIRAFLEQVRPGERPVAVLDWDNTMIKNDVGRAVAYHLIQRGLVRQPRTWAEMPGIADVAARRLDEVCRGPGINAPATADCVEELLHMLENEALAAGTPAFEAYDHDQYKASAAMQAFLLARYTPAEATELARQVVEARCRAPAGHTVQVAGMTLPAYLRIYGPMVRLVRVLERKGFEVWVVSASPEPVVRAMAAMVGIAPERVVGVRQLTDAPGRLRMALVGCGNVEDDKNTLIPYKKGKRCWIREAIGREVRFAAGDSATDLTFLADAAGLRLVIDRGDPELLCHALHHLDGGKWVINPMFIAPRFPAGDPYPCATRACTDPTGDPAPCRDAEGRVIPDQLPPEMRRLQGQGSRTRLAPATAGPNTEQEPEPATP